MMRVLMTLVLALGFGPLCASAWESYSSCAAHRGPGRAKRAQERLQPVEKLRGNIEQRSPSAGSLAARGAVLDDNAIERPFAAGGLVRLALASGAYTLRGSSNDRLAIRWTARENVKLTDLQKLSVEVQVAGTTALVDTDGPADRVFFTIEMPARSDLHLRMRAGELRVDGIEGHKDIRITAGDVKIEVQPETLARARASVTFGDIDADPLGIRKTGIKRSFKWIGSGTYSLDARLFAGDLTLR